MRLAIRSMGSLLCLALFTAVPAGVLLELEPAPEWKVSQWINDDPGRLADNRGKVVLIHFFQLWCPGCHEFTIPLFQEWSEMYADQENVLIVSIHTVFEGHDVQTPELLQSFVTQKGITHPVGIDAYENNGDRVPITMDRYDTGGTPHVAIIDQDGNLRFSHFGRFDRAVVERFIERVIKEDKQLNLKSTKRQSGPKKRTRKSRPRETPAERGPAASEPVDKEPEELASDLSGSYKLRLEQLSKSCGEIARPFEVITQISVYDNRVEAKFSRAYLGLRQLVATYDSGSGSFETNQQQQAQQNSVVVDLSLQLTGRILQTGDAPEIEYDYYFEKTSVDGTADCVIEGKGGGARFRAR